MVAVNYKRDGGAGRFCLIGPHEKPIARNEAAQAENHYANEGHSVPRLDCRHAEHDTAIAT
jgi:hypothetical protein